MEDFESGKEGREEMTEERGGRVTAKLKKRGEEIKKNRTTKREQCNERTKK